MSDEGKVIGIVSYLSWLGWIIALILNMDKKDKLARFHIRQSLLILLAFMVVGAVGGIIPIIGWFIILPVGMIFLVVCWIIGLVAAIQGEEKEIPLIGKYAQDWFKGI